MKTQSIKIDFETKGLLDKLKAHPRQSYNEVITILVKDKLKENKK